ncbi:MAG: MDR family oxidoreductase [Thermoleophilia bacterium]
MTTTRSRSRFRALVLHEGELEPRAEVGEVEVLDLPEGDVLVEVAYSSLNYKDALAVTGAGRIVRGYPMVPGIDLAGRVVHSDSPVFRPGDRVVLTGWGIGEAHWGGFAELARVRSEWLVPCPEGMSLKHAMALGTAGLTAMLAVMALEEAGVLRVAGGAAGPPEFSRASEPNEVLVTGASGGVGSIAIVLLAPAGHRVVASSGRHESAAYLHSLGAEEVIERADLELPAKPLEPQRWAGAIDSVGGDTLARVLAETRYGGAVAACGLMGGSALNTTVMPFILRAVRLVGINSVSAPQDLRQVAWQRLAREVHPDVLDGFTRVASLEEVHGLAITMTAGRGRGRTVVELLGGD